MPTKRFSRVITIFTVFGKYSYDKKQEKICPPPPSLPHIHEYKHI